VKGSFASGETGSVFVAGEWWNAQLVGEAGQEIIAVQIGDTVEIVGRRGYMLLVRPVA
jgi:membrane protein implicated in regulation of membrane protease activity